MTDTETVVADAIESAVIGPDDVLVLLFDQMSAEQFARLQAVLDERQGGLRGRILIVAGAKTALVARGAAKAVER